MPTLEVCGSEARAVQAMCIARAYRGEIALLAFDVSDLGIKQMSETVIEMYETMGMRAIYLYYVGIGWVCGQEMGAMLERKLRVWSFDFTYLVTPSSVPDQGRACLLPAVRCC